ncbi:hypothetical protein EPA93_13870 [Ktedonosporobacter rubrisoli]|uniref:Uncharacterized protein n=1 Tax=Ktedonosporobacter rubrisoli TaxID=2509675 RepID=A0A4V0YYQ4_KTERU|nr:hypothetical protein [Ktedonosporobacter rubrisoli]QBD77031.1 hypothetical protein EPA93_13870 [Ktedonosporobacter rubrisoli]
MAEQENVQRERAKNRRPQPEAPNVSQEQFTNRGTQEGYSNLGPHGDFGDFDDEANTAPDNYGEQDQFADLDNQDPYSNLYDEDPGSTPGGEDMPEDELYGLAEPLAEPGDKSRKGASRDWYGTRRSQDQQGYQQ